LTQQVVTVEQVRGLVGKEEKVVTVEVDRGIIRRFAQAIGDPNPLWQDEEYAKKSKFGGIVAPPELLCTSMMSGGAIRPEVALPFVRVLDGGGEWDEDAAWEDRRYSKYSLAYFLTGVLDKDIDGVRGPGYARPIADGSFLGIGYPVGASRDRYEPLMDTDRRGARLSQDYVEPNEFPEHLLDGSDPLDRSAIYASYQDYQRDALVSIVDAFGNAFRYYRWEPGRVVNGQLVVENQLDLNLPPVLIDPVELAKVENNTANLDQADLTSGNTNLRNARFAIVSAGPDGLFGTEDLKTIADALGVEEPSDLEEIAKLRQDVWADNAVEVGGS